MRSGKILLMALLAVSLSGCSYNISFLIVNLTSHDLIVMYKHKSVGYGPGLTTDPKVFRVRAEDGGYVPDSLLQELSFGIRETVRVVVPSQAAFDGGDSGRPHPKSYEGMEWLMVVRTELGDTLKVPGSMIIEFIQEVNDRDIGLIFDEKCASL